MEYLFFCNKVSLTSYEPKQYFSVTAEFLDYKKWLITGIYTDKYFDVSEIGFIK